ncbi:NAD-dependent epimerase/dehydratase family protein [Hahella sp. KA22]|uniref:NAD(P)H-binding protein n=1 Tax=Hahella sp. KA22 TaxID=1628392 RepID=UPI000FDF2AE5|nr:NAD(P)H-binding protein [Hahella sp. KA22]AZZ95258.1 NAD-dependent epimerase/dehydratase family protein [Hahella sp. KA22]QAY52903.1 NAD-dependent epimerase/dehydratase family protein [Hahella sp. KA22]
MKILLTGAGGFIASVVLEKLLEQGCQVVAVARRRANIPVSDSVTFVQADLHHLTRMEDWSSMLRGVDAVINCAGILREPRKGDFDLVHFQAPKALVEACLQNGVERFVQVSALGTEQDGGFITSKHKFDDYLMRALPTAVVLRPSVVLSERGSYGGTSLLRALAALPYLLFIPGSGDQKIQPILLEDLASVVAQAATRTEDVQSLERSSGVAYTVGPEVITLREYLTLMRRWLKFPAAKLVSVPLSLIGLVAWIGQRLGAGPLNDTVWGMLQRGNYAEPGAYERSCEKFDYAPRSVKGYLQTSASFVQDRWHARLYLLREPIWLTLVVVWMLSGVAGIGAQPETFSPILKAMGLPEFLWRPMVWLTSAVDLALGVFLLSRRHMALAGQLMLACTLGYTLALGLLAPAVWLEPLGGLLKNLPLLCLLSVFLAVEKLR